VDVKLITTMCSLCEKACPAVMKSYKCIMSAGDHDAKLTTCSVEEPMATTLALVTWGSSSVAVCKSNDLDTFCQMTMRDGKRHKEFLNTAELITADISTESNIAYRTQDISAFEAVRPCMQFGNVQINNERRRHDGN